ncbi:Alpha/Beta hydrolase protein, partial [Mycena olivaceomarginata]
MKLLLSASLAALISSVLGADNLTVKTSTGTYTGLIDSNFPNTRQFRSVAFAEPPVTARRWLPPTALSKSAAHHYSRTTFRPRARSSSRRCRRSGTNSSPKNHTSGLVGEATSEDCLYLAVWTPAKATSASKLPVLFFMTGGGLQTGGVNIEWQFPTGWVERTQAHRRHDQLPAQHFGFPNARGLAAQNLGILDQRMALEWVRDNVAAFGGDPAKITQWGQSSGSISTDIHSHAFYADPIARGYFLQSGTVLTQAAAFPFVDTTHSNFSSRRAALR